jgi:hypothetical protein
MKIGLDGDLAAALVTDLVRCGVVLERGTTATSFDLGPGCAVDRGGSSGGGGLLGEGGLGPLKITLDSGKVSAGFRIGVQKKRNAVIIPEYSFF